MINFNKLQIQLQRKELTQLFDMDNTHSLRKTSYRQNGCKGLHQHQPSIEDHQHTSFRRCNSAYLKELIRNLSESGLSLQLTLSNDTTIDIFNSKRKTTL